MSAPKFFSVWSYDSTPIWNTQPIYTVQYLALSTQQLPQHRSSCCSPFLLLIISTGPYNTEKTVLIDNSSNLTGKLGGKSLKASEKRRVSHFTIQGTVSTKVLKLLIYGFPWLPISPEMWPCLSHVNPVMNLPNIGDLSLPSGLFSLIFMSPVLYR